MMMCLWHNHNPDCTCRPQTLLDTEQKDILDNTIITAEAPPIPRTLAYRPFLMPQTRHPLPPTTLNKSLAAPGVPLDLLVWARNLISTITRNPIFPRQKHGGGQRSLYRPYLQPYP
jgi:hypothetical protein